MFFATALAIIVGMLLALSRAFAGPSLYDRILAGNSFGTMTVLLLGVMGFLMGRPDFLDIALVYALINFAGTIAILKFFRYRTLSKPMGGPTAGAMGEESADGLHQPQFRVEHQTGVPVSPVGSSSVSVRSDEGR